MKKLNIESPANSRHQEITVYGDRQKANNFN